MSKAPNKKLIGLFSIIGVSIFIGIVLIFVGDKVFNRNNTMLVMYFEESIKGLTIGSSVSFKGVEIGKVSKIDLMTDIKDMDFGITVFVKLNEEQNFRVGDFREIRNKDAFLEKLIEKGLRARLTTQSYLTGQLMIELEMLPNSKAILKNYHYSKNTIEIPTVLSPMGELSKGLQDIPIKETVIKFNNLLDVINTELPVILTQTAGFTKSLNQTFSDNIGGTPTTINNINKTLSDIGEAARSIKNLADYLERHPEALLKGKKNY